MSSRRVRIACKCGYRIFPEDPLLVKIDGLNFGGDDWWIEVQCRKCRDVCIFGGPAVAYSPNSVGKSNQRIVAPDYC